MKAKYIGKYRDKDGYAVHLFYEYQGKEYIVTDSHNGYMESLKEQHEKEQARIDRELDNPVDTEVVSTNDAEEGFKMFFEMIGGI